MTSLRVICGLGPPPIKNLGYAYGIGSVRSLLCDFEKLLRRYNVQYCQIVDLLFLFRF